MEWNEQGKSELPRLQPVQCHFVHLKPHIEWPGIEPVSPQAYKYQLRNFLLCIADG